MDHLLYLAVRQSLAQIGKIVAAVILNQDPDTTGLVLGTLSLYVDKLKESSTDEVLEKSRSMMTKEEFDQLYLGIIEWQGKP